MSKLVVNCGGMFSGKTSELQRQGKRHLLAGKKVCFLKPSIDNRYSKDHVVNHDGKKVSAINVEVEDGFILKNEILNSDVVLIDEVQFFEIQIVAQIKKLLLLGKDVYCSGLDMDFKGDPFKTTIELMGLADEVYKFKAVCSNCGNDATFSARLNDSEEIVNLGEKELYRPLCRSCYHEFLEKKYI